MKRLHCVLISACLAGCTGGGAVTESPFLGISKTNYGVFVGVDPTIEAGIADEAAQQLWNIYPPSHNLLTFQQRVADTDSFGGLLASALQREGFFVRQWFDPAVPAQCDKKIADKKNDSSDDSSDFRIVPVCYLVDDVSGMLRLTLYAAGGRWSRFFETEQDKLKPIGAWTQQKGEQEARYAPNYP